MSPNGRKRQKSDQKKMKEIIHSGHFMVSDIDDPEVQDGEESPSLVVHESDCDQESLPLPVKGFDFESACKETSKTYTFGNRSSHSISIDASLTKLFECMTLAYSGKLTSPRWKQFKGLKLRLKEKIRLNNMIWRAWHMQFVMKIKTDKLCQFATPLDGDTHMKPEAVVIEGTYWKRRMASITAEYKKWRLFYRDRFRMKPSPETENQIAMDLDMRWSVWPKDTYSSFQSAMDEDYLMDFSDTLFSSFNPSQPFDFPNPREIAAKAGIADFIQPGLVQLQPSVDDFMDTLEPLSDLFSDFLNSKLPPLPEEGTFNSNNLQEILQTTSEQQDVFGASKISFGGRNITSSAYSQASSTLTTPSTSKRNSFRKHTPPRSFQQSRISSPPFSNKTVLENITANSGRSALLTEDVPLISSEQSPSRVNALQPFLCNNVPSQPSEDSTIASLLQGSLQSDMRIQQTQESLPPPLNISAVSQRAKRERTSQFFQQPAFISKSFDETDLSRHHLTQTPSTVQVPLQSIAQGQIAENILLNSNANEAKSSKHPLFFSLS